MAACGPEVAAHMDNPVTSYSGGGKMRIQLTAAKLKMQMMAFSPSVDEPGWWWVQNTCNEAYKLEP